MGCQVLCVLSSHGVIDGTDKETGWFLPELAHPYYVLTPVAELVVTSPKGGLAPLSRQSVDMAHNAESQQFFREKKALWEHTERLESFRGRASEFEAIFLLLVAQAIIREFHAAGKIISAVCHGSIALARVRLLDDTHLIAGQRVTGFSNEEGESTGLRDFYPALLEPEMSKYISATGSYEAVAPWSANVVVSGKDGKLITGQNPASAKGVGEAIRRAITSSIN